MFPNQGHLAVTFSFDDGVTQDRRLLALFHRYGFKGTFNLNSGLFGKHQLIAYQGHVTTHDFVKASEVKSLYAGQEVAVHTLTHPDLTRLSDEEVLHEVEGDRQALEALVGYPLAGMAYPYGTFDERILSLLKEKTPLRYARGVASTGTFEPERDHFLSYQPSVYEFDYEKLADTIARFLALKESSEDQILYIWGHSYELDFFDTWGKLESLLKPLSLRKDLYFGTNSEVFFPR